MPDKVITIAAVAIFLARDGTRNRAISILFELPRSSLMEKALEIIGIQTAYAITEDTEKPGETIETDFRQFRSSWYKSERWVTDYQAPLPPSASRHLLIAVQEELCPEVDFAHMEVVAKQFLAGLHLEDVLPGVPGYVFVIHGRDEVSLARLAALIERRGFTPIILGRQSVRGGRTVIEDLEDRLPQADLVVALLTPDDEGRLRGSANPLRPRARQNVLY
jgi:hypothetical protein